MPTVVQILVTYQCYFNRAYGHTQTTGTGGPGGRLLAWVNEALVQAVARLTFRVLTLGSQVRSLLHVTKVSTSMASPHRLLFD